MQAAPRDAARPKAVSMFSGNGALLFTKLIDLERSGEASRRHQSAPASRSRACKPDTFFSQLAHNNLSYPLFRNPDRIPDCPKRRARFPCPRYRPVTTDSARNLLLHSGDHRALDAFALFRRRQEKTPY
jgi:hypothetical protein